MTRGTWPSAPTVTRTVAPAPVIPHSSPLFVTALLVSLEDHVGAVDRRQRNRSSGGAKGEEEEEEEEEAKALEGCC